MPMPMIIELTNDISKRIKTIINEIDECCIDKDPNIMMEKLIEILKNLKFSGEKYNREILLLCENEMNFVQYPLLSRLRISCYQILERIFNKKVKKVITIQINTYEYSMLLMAEMKLLSYQKLENVKTTYIKFCKKMNIVENELLLKQLESGFDSCFNGIGVNGYNIMEDNGIFYHVFI